MAKYYGVRPEFQLEVLATWGMSEKGKDHVSTQRAFGFTLCEALAAARHDELTHEAK